MDIQRVDKIIEQMKLSYEVASVVSDFLQPHGL